uniref:hypothetical protein n=1 Tax=Flavobacterium sp. TaxID=239 RepID=UPI00404A13CD
MRKFISKTLFLITLIASMIFIFLELSTVIVKNRAFENYNCESNTLFLESNQQFDVLLLGISHGREFSRHKNHLRVEKILNAKMINFSQGSATCGTNEQLFYVDYFYFKNNKTRKIVYILSPSLLFSEFLPQASNTFDQEVFDVQFLYRYTQFESENKGARIMSYLQRKLHPVWLLKKPITEESKLEEVDSLNKNTIELGQNMAFNGPVLNTEQFKKSIKSVEKTIKLAALHDSEVILVIPPALFGKWRGHQETLDFAKNMQTKHPNVTIFDGSETILDPQFFYDSHHLNTKGIELFTEKYLKKLVK